MPDAVQDQKTVFALDIGTRSIVGVLGREEGGRFHVLAIEKEEHGRRAMLDGQIEDIAQVAAIARRVTDRLEQRQGIVLKRVCVAAAGRALRSAKASFTLEFAEPRQADDETINQLEAGAVSAAESVVADGGEGTFYMVGYTASQYRLDGYPMSTLSGHRGRVMEADVVATFLPREVVDSLYTVVARLGLEVSSLTLEPIASLNAAIPIDIRLLNLVLVDIGAGTSDIAVCRDGSVAGYTMATVAGDEVTELLMKKLLVDFRTGEALKMEIGKEDPLRYTDILGLPHECSSEKLIDLIEPAVQLLAREIADRVLELNGAVPSAVFLAGGGSKLYGIRQAVAQAIGMDDARVAVAGNHFERNAFTEGEHLNDPEYSTPLGIAVSAALGMINDSYVVTLNGVPAKLFRSGTLNVRDILLMNGCKYGDMMGRTGANLSFTLDGARQFVRGTHGTPPVIRLNGIDAELSDIVHAGDDLEFVPAKAGENATRTLGEVLGEDFRGGGSVNGKPQGLSYRLCTGDSVETGADKPVPLPTAQPAREEEPTAPPEQPQPEPVRAWATVQAEGQAEASPVDVPVKPPRSRRKAAEPEQEEQRPLEGQLRFDGTQEPVPSPVHKPIMEPVPAEEPAPVPQAEEPPVQPGPVQPEPAPQPVKVKPVLPSAATGMPEHWEEPKRRGVPRVVLPDIPGLGLPRAASGLHIRLNGKPLELPPKASGDPYYFMDILQYSGLDFNRLEHPVELLLNGSPCEFTQALAAQDEVVVRYKA